MIELSEDILLKMYFKMHQARFFDEKVADLGAQGLVHGPTYLSSGQEAASVVTCMAIEEGDLLSLSPSSHAQAIGFGLDVNLMMAEILGKVTGYCRGKGGPSHIADPENGNLGGNGMVGGGFGLSCGAALSQKLQETGKIVLSFAGDGATNQGSFHEAMNLAALWKLPIIFFIENNGSKGPGSLTRHMKIENIADRGLAYDIPGLTIDGNDFLNVYDIVSKASRYVRAGKGPVLLEAKIDEAKGDPILRLKKYLKDHRVFTDDQMIKIEDEAKKTIEIALDFALKSEGPDITTVLDHVYAAAEVTG